MTTNRNAVVVGGGIGGILATLILARRGWSTTLIERAHDLGGLMGSVPGPGDHMYDFGTHFVADTGISAIDQLMVDSLPPQEWREFRESLREGNVFRGDLDSESGCIDARLLPWSTYEQGLQQLTTAEPEGLSFASLADELTATYGQIFCEQIFRPVIRKLTGEELEQLSTGTHKLFSITRLIVADSEISRELKTSPRLDNTVAYRSFTDGRSSIRKFYPRRGGVGRWIEHLEQALSRAGVKLMKGNSVKGLEKSGDRIEKLTLSNGSRLECDLLVWTLPAAIFAFTAGIGNPRPPEKTITLNLFHMLFDAPLTSDLHWISVYDSDFLSYRVTLYPNIISSSVPPPPHNVTVEVLSHNGFEPSEHFDRIHSELEQIGAIARGSRCIGQTTQVLPNAIPVPTLEFVSEQQQNIEAIAGYATNFLPVGRAAGHHFQRDILIDVYQSVTGSEAIGNQIG